MVPNGCVKYKEMEVDRSAIMQYFQDNEKKNLNGRLAAILNFISAKFVMGYSCVRHYIFFIFMVQLFCNSSYANITKLLKLKMAYIAEHICQIERRCDGNFFLKHANEHFFVSGHSN